MAVEDPGFSFGGGGVANSKSRCANLLHCKFFAENCMEMKEFGPRVGGDVPNAPLGSANEWYQLLSYAYFTRAFIRKGMTSKSEISNVSF